MAYIRMNTEETAAETWQRPGKEIRRIGDIIVFSDDKERCSRSAVRQKRENGRESKNVKVRYTNQFEKIRRERSDGVGCIEWKRK